MLSVINIKYIILFYNGFSSETNPIIFAIYNIQNETLYYKIVYEHRGFPTITLPATHMITSALVPGGDDPYPLIHINNSYMFITPDRKVYVFYPGDGLLKILDTLNISGDYIVKYIYVGNDEVLLLSGPPSFSNPIKLTIYKYNICSRKLQKLYVFDLSNTDYGRLVIQSLNFTNLKGFFIRELTLPSTDINGQISQEEFTDLALLFVKINNTYMPLNLTTDHRPVSQVFELENGDLYAYMLDNYELTVFMPSKLYIGLSNISYMFEYIDKNVSGYIIYPYNHVDSFLIIGIKYIGYYQYQAEIVIAKYIPGSILFKPLNEKLIPQILLLITIIFILARRIRLYRKI